MKKWMNYTFKGKEVNMMLIGKRNVIFLLVSFIFGCSSLLLKDYIVASEENSNWRDFCLDSSFECGENVKIKVKFEKRTAPKREHLLGIVSYNNTASVTIHHYLHVALFDQHKKLIGVGWQWFPGGLKPGQQTTGIFEFYIPPEKFKEIKFYQFSYFESDKEL
ncbi:MAG: hypothetical protein NC833_02435 [Candidatus Omnitrophica bacterium]|nr:hypothetical protein [Candidatus Omnitrophota bacterium]